MDENTIKLEKETAKLISGLKKMSASDYLAARVLFENNLLEQACILSSQAIEKQFKVILKVHGFEVKDTHSLANIFGFLKNKSKLNFGKINKEYLSTLDNIFRGRYIGDAKFGYNYVVIKNKFLCELDYTFNLLEEMVQLKIGNGNNKPRNYKFPFSEKDLRFTTNNYLFESIPKDKFLNRNDLVLECRILSNGILVSFLYSIPNSFDDGIFSYEALIFNEDGNSAKLCFKGIVNHPVSQLNIGSVEQ